MRYVYPARFQQDKESVLVTFRDLPEAITEGVDLLAAVQEAYATLEAALWFRLKNDEEIPVPSEPQKGEVAVPVEPATAAKLALALAFRESNLTRVQLAEAVKADHKEIRRMLDPAHRTKIERLDAVMRALGQRLVVSTIPDETVHL